ncbi:MAG: dehypoxanthine futalosine cyclase [Planctomycetota bacterium]|nr:dehypoxanthine futalosine cyclase [Planctomycetota bacterium]
MSAKDANTILQKAAGGERLSPEDGLLLLERAELNDLGAAALAVKNRLHPEPVATFVIDRNINYTNVCVADCDFCAFYRRPGDVEAYVLPRETLYRKIRELAAIGGTQILMQGGHHPRLQIEWYEELLSDLRREFPDVHRHAFSPSEIVFFSKLWKLPVREIVRRFKAAGLQSIPGGGGEILVDRVRKIIAPKKAMTDEWLDVYVQAHAEGLKGSVSMVIGHYETLAERIEHLERVRQVQDRCGGLDAGPWTAFIVWTMQPDHTLLEGKIRKAGAVEYLRMLAVSRLYLDNIRNLQASWVTQGAKVGQLSFLHGCNDWGGFMMEENVVSQAGTVHRVQIEQMRRMSAELGLTLRQRNFFYELIDAPPEPVAAG